MLFSIYALLFHLGFRALSKSEAESKHSCFMSGPKYANMSVWDMAPRCAEALSPVPLFATPWTAARQAPLSTGFSSKNTGVGCHALFQGIFPTQELNGGLLNCRQILYQLSYQGSQWPLDLGVNPGWRQAGCPCPEPWMLTQESLFPALAGEQRLCHAAASSTSTVPQRRH